MEGYSTSSKVLRLKPQQKTTKTKNSKSSNLHRIDNHHHQLMLIAHIPLTLSHHLSLLAFAFGRSCRLHPVSAWSWWMWVFAVQPALVCPCGRVHRRTLPKSLPLLLQQYSACLVSLTWMVCEIGGKWPYYSFFFECYFQDLFKTACSNFVWFPLTFSQVILRVQLVQPYSSTSMAIAWKNSCFILSERSDFHMINSRSIAVCTYVDVTFSRWDNATEVCELIN